MDSANAQHGQPGISNPADELPDFHFPLPPPRVGLPDDLEQRRLVIGRVSQYYPGTPRAEIEESLDLSLQTNPNAPRDYLMACPLPVQYGDNTVLPPPSDFRAPSQAPGHRTPLETLSLTGFVNSPDYQAAFGDMKIETARRGGRSLPPENWAHVLKKVHLKTIEEYGGFHGLILGATLNIIPIRDLVWRDKMNPRTGILQFLSIVAPRPPCVDSTYVQITGRRGKVECEQCKLSEGPWMECVSLSPHWDAEAGTVACANCIFTGNQDKCSFVPGAWPPRPPTPSPPRLPAGYSFHETV